MPRPRSRAPSRSSWTATAAGPRRTASSVAEGHRAGSRALRPVVETAIDLGVESLAVYAFSTENWTRSADEVEALMEIFGETIDRELARPRQGRRAHAVRRPPRPCAGLAAGEDRASSRRRRRARRGSTSGSRSTTAAAPRSSRPRGGIAESGEEVDEESFARHLYAPEMPDPDLVIRTSGELRVSNFLLWQSAYAEFVFTDTLWPDFGPNEFRAAIEDYASRRRRFGGR